jgi:hypothetical protein
MKHPVPLVLVPLTMDNTEGTGAFVLSLLSYSSDAERGSCLRHFSEENGTITTKCPITFEGIGPFGGLLVLLG